MALNLYLDDCANADLLADLLTRAGHGVVRSKTAGITIIADFSDKAQPVDRTGPV